MKRSALALLQDANPVSQEDGRRWHESHATAPRVASLIEQSDAVALDAVTPSDRSVRSRRRGAAVAVAAALASIAVFVAVIQIVDRDSGTEVAIAVAAEPTSVELGVDSVWVPPVPVGSAEEAVAAFVKDVLATEAQLEVDPIAGSDDPTWVTMALADGDVGVLCVPDADQGWRIIQVGDPPPLRVEGEQLMLLVDQVPPGTQSATVYARDARSTSRVDVDAAALNAQEIALTGIGALELRSAVTVFVDEAGRVLSASGGHY